jgi:hypothetical protein
MKQNIDVRYRKVWIRNEKQEEKMNENQVPEIVLTRFATTQDHDESIGKEEDVRIQEEDEEEDSIIQEEDGNNVRIQEEDDDESTDEDEYYFAS